VSDSKRTEMRIPYRGTVRFSADQFNWYLNKAHNISKKGIFIETEEKFTVGTKLYLNFDLTANDEVVKKIRTIGEVVRLAGSAEKGTDAENGGLGIRFSLLESEEAAMRAFVKDVVDSSLDGLFSGAESPAKHVCVKIHDAEPSFLGWWLQEAVNKMLSTHGLIIELTVILIFIVIGIILFA
jgi:Tfp pilus assembly protein PilZ